MRKLTKDFPGSYRNPGMDQKSKTNLWGKKLARKAREYKTPTADEMVDYMISCDDWVENLVDSLEDE